MNTHFGMWRVKLVRCRCARAPAKALADAGLNWSDVDAIYDAGEGGGMGGLTIAEYFALNPSVIDTNQYNVGGRKAQFHGNG